MRILVLSNASYAPPRGGSTRSNLVWLADLASRGHQCEVVCPPAGGGQVDADAVLVDGIRIVRVPDLARHTELAARAIGEFAPDWLLVSSEDLSHTLLRTAWRCAPDRIIYLAHTPQWFPFGPASWHKDAEAASIVARSRAIVSIGRHMAGYISRHLGREAHVVHPPIYGRPPFPNHASFERAAVLMVNPCAVKGIDIFLALAERFPHIPFFGLRGWGTTSADVEAMRRHDNVRLLEPVPRIDEALSRAGILLVPSLWYEGFGLIAMEAMLRGLPVIASDSGGLVEAKAGTGYVVPVAPIEKWLSTFDENHMPRPVVQRQEISGWEAALRRLLEDRAEYEAESHRSRQAALRFVSALDAGDFARLLESLRTAAAPPRRLRILLAHNSLYYPSHGGGDRSNRLLMEALARRGHHTCVVARIERFGEEGHLQHLAELEARQLHGEVSAAGAVITRLNGVEVHTVTRNPRFRSYFDSVLERFGPDVILTSTDDPAQLLYERALRYPGARLVHLVRATIAVPFGPDASSPSPERTALLRQADSVVGVSEYVARYLRQHGRIDAVHLPISLMEPGEPPDLARPDNPYVTLVNPCAVKGISILLALAARMPAVRFAAVPTWGANAADRAALARHSNITILPPADDINDILRLTRVLLVPSLWAEARSRLVVEAQARGIPVIASAVGGIPEAKLGVPYLLPVRPIASYKQAVDENMVPVAEVPEQDIDPWQQALEKLLGEEDHWREISRASRQAALQYMRGLSVEPFERHLMKVLEAPKRSVPATTRSNWSEDRQKLLSLRLQRLAAGSGSRREESLWFPTLAAAAPDAPLLFCFPFAGGGALFYRNWQSALGSRCRICPVLLPGRESRIGETPVDSMPVLVDRLLAAIRPYLSPPFAFYGHSMGAGIAFELARALRRANLPLPAALLVSGARAPQYRLGHTPQPEPGEEEFLAEIRRLQGAPAEVLSRGELLNLILPALRADARLYRNYVYLPEEPLNLPLVAYGGLDDPNVAPEHIAAWSQQSSVRFQQRLFRGGHFFIQTAAADFLSALRDDIESLIPAALPK